MNAPSIYFFRKGTLKEKFPFSLKNGETKYIEFVAEHDVLNQQYIVVMRDISSKKMLERERSMNGGCLKICLTEPLTEWSFLIKDNFA
ncbi:hypothetical protein ACEQPO_10625 [Bacillus sp. SL00103]